ncbi:MFS transporter [Arthrobacter sp. NPDC058097]|uniref:MFS transporter n=1 Tax=Arthrobacter sp. NPDC058097 TaxID=3346340 RepID=UPI0036DC80B0
MTIETAHPRVGQQAKRALISGTLGNSIEYYEFSIYGLAAALVFKDLFFPGFSATAGTLLSLSTFAIAFISRPLGSIVLGHFGDKFGRKKTLMFALVLMASSTVAIGLLPTFSMIGIWAPLLLVVLRLLQGFSLGGEYSGSILLALEHVRPGLRGLFSGIITSGLAWGTLLANALLLALSFLPDDQFLAWGWRIPFLASSVLFAVTMYLRTKVEESPDFERAAAVRAAENKAAKVPLIELLRHHWKTLLLVIMTIPGAGGIYYIATVFSLTYATGQLKMDRSAILTAVIAVNIVMIIAMPLAGWWADRTANRRRHLLWSFVGMGASAWIWFLLMNTRNVPLMMVGFVIMFIPFSINYASLPATFAHAFPPSVRFSGMGTGYNIGSLVGSAFTPMIAASILSGGGTWHWIAAFMAGSNVVALVSACFLRERYVNGRETRDAEAPQMVPSTTPV